MTPLTEAADAVTSAINAQNWGSHVFTARRKWLPVWILKDIKNVQVIVAPVSDSTIRETRHTHTHNIRVDIGVLRKLSRADLETEEIDPLADLADSIAEYFRTGGDGGRSPRVGSFAVVSVLHDPIVAREHLDSHSQFTSVIQLSLTKVS
jgi:hypothetical protein